MKYRAIGALIWATATPAPVQAETRVQVDSGKVIGVAGGSMEAGVEAQFSYDSSKELLSERSKTSLIGGPFFRYFIVENLALSIHAAATYSRTSSQQKTQPNGSTCGLIVSTQSGPTCEGGQLSLVTPTLGALGTLSVSYHAHLAGGLFLVPSLGGGGFFEEGDSRGFVGRGGLGLAFFSGRLVNVFVRPELMFFQGVKPHSNGGTVEFSRLTGEFSGGMGVVF